MHLPDMWVETSGGQIASKWEISATIFKCYLTTCLALGLMLCGLLRTYSKGLSCYRTPIHKEKSTDSIQVIIK